MATQAKSAALTPTEVDWSRFDFVDFGCSNGGSLAHCQKRFRSKRGVGIDIDPKKLRTALDKGRHVIQGDLHDLPGRNVVRFVSMMQFLEHLPSLDEVERAIGKAADLATDFLYIHHPSFEDEHYLTGQGLRLYFHDWHGHLTHVLRDDLFQIFERLGLLQYHVRPIKPIYDSGNSVIIPTSAPQDQHEYDPEPHGPKPQVEFPVPVFQHMEIFVALRSFEPKEWRDVVMG